ncbi:hypothetical protein [Dactylosporangium sp. NPDC051541]|uniref:hypothetical protein n=1 Tax=Dactylosporangium sp. NPDC051541 TaxID=3363977 RepID=UPI00378EF190
MRPVMLVLSAAGEALASALRRRFGADYEVVAFTEPGEALAALGAITDPVALLIAGPGQEDFLVEAHEEHPGAKRVLLVARGDWSAGHPATPPRARRCSKGPHAPAAACRWRFIVTGRCWSDPVGVTSRTCSVCRRRHPSTAATW